MRINENVALAKSILNKSGITPDSKEYEDYLKIREICGNSHGYVGILTKIRFVDDIVDMVEIESIFNILKNSKIDIAKLNKMNYNDILDIFYDELNVSNNSDYEIVHKDKTYTYYLVHTYEGMLEIGSPAWCLKTKSHWNTYNNKFTHHFVVIDNEYKNKLASPKEGLYNNYKINKPYVRYGVSINKDSKNYVAFNDNNNEKTLDFKKDFCFSGVLITIVNLLNDIKKSFYEHFPGAKKIDNSINWLKIVDKDKFKKASKLNVDKYSSNEGEIYVKILDNYLNIFTLCLNNNIPYLNLNINNDLGIKNNSYYIDYDNGKSMSYNLLYDYAINSSDTIFSGFKYDNNLCTIDDIKNINSFVNIVDNWAIFDRNDNYYLIVNIANDKKYKLPVIIGDKLQFALEDPMFFYISKKLKKFILFNVEFDFNKVKNTENLIKYLKDKNKKVSGFLNFFKNKS